MAARATRARPGTKGADSAKRFRLVHYQHPDEFGRWLGYAVERAKPGSGKARVRLQIRRDHLSPAGRVHGGVVSALFDYACGAAAFTTLEALDLIATIELKVNYLRPLENGDRLRVESRVVFRGRRLCVTQGELFRGKDREPSAIATATFNIVPAAAAQAKAGGAGGKPRTRNARS